MNKNPWISLLFCLLLIVPFLFSFVQCENFSLDSIDLNRKDVKPVWATVENHVKQDMEDVVFGDLEQAWAGIVDGGTVYRVLGPVSFGGTSVLCDAHVIVPFHKQDEEDSMTVLHYNFDM
eukprot:gb/GECH01011667.1/.p1 GENE.gb/GECH01011667.1/~~gb/GECH01011667.1/.p1  ORF type:complete len:120 (+),score=20.63 gb/GECH01011667.1/:1-360(+)